jgi:DNA-binding GntR family transcriptional regulator
MSTILTLKEQAYQKLKSLILNGDLSSESLTERSLVDQLGMSRTPIRSALERLELEGLLNYTPNKGLTIAELSVKKVIDFYDFRMAVESYVVKKLALRTLSDIQIKEIQENLDKQKESLKIQDYSGFTILDFEYHKMLAFFYNNKEIIQTIENLHDRLYQIAFNVLKKDLTRINKSYEDHVNIFNFIMARKSKDAAELMIQHFEEGKEILIS